MKDDFIFSPSLDDVDIDYSFYGELSIKSLRKSKTHERHNKHLHLFALFLPSFFALFSIFLSLASIHSHFLHFPSHFSIFCSAAGFFPRIFEISVKISRLLIRMFLKLCTFPLDNYGFQFCFFFSFSFLKSIFAFQNSPFPPFFFQFSFYFLHFYPFFLDVIVILIFREIYAYFFN